MASKERRQIRYEKIFKPTYEAFIALYPFTLEDLDGEQWADIESYEGLYQISTFGRVKSFWHGKVTILKPTLTVFGYLRVDLCKNKKTKHFPIHKIVANAFVPNTENKREVDHVNGDKLNCCVSNLRWATRHENERYAYSLGVKSALQGENCPVAKFTNKQVVYMRDNPDNLSINELAELFKCNTRIISAIQLGKSYRSAGGKIREKIERRIPDEIRAKIRAEYKRGVYGCGLGALAKKYGVDARTVSNIIKEGD